MRKVDDRKKKKRKKKIMSFLVATNVVASRPPERRPTGTPHNISKMYTKWAVENVQYGISRLLEAEKYNKNKSGNCFAGHEHPLFQKVSYVSF